MAIIHSIALRSKHAALLNLIESPASQCVDHQRLWVVTNCCSGNKLGGADPARAIDPIQVQDCTRQTKQLLKWQCGCVLTVIGLFDVTGQVQIRAGHGIVGEEPVRAIAL